MSQGQIVKGLKLYLRSLGFGLFMRSWRRVQTAVGSGSKGKGGEIQPVSMKDGNKVLLPEYGGTKVVPDKDYFLFRDGDILGKYVDRNKSLLKWHHVTQPILLKY